MAVRVIPFPRSSIATIKAHRVDTIINTVFIIYSFIFYGAFPAPTKPANKNNKINKPNPNTSANIFWSNSIVPLPIPSPGVLWQGFYLHKCAYFHRGILGKTYKTPQAEVKCCL